MKKCQNILSEIVGQKLESRGLRIKLVYDDGGEAWVAPGDLFVIAIAHQSKWEADVRENIFQPGVRCNLNNFLVLKLGHPTLNSPIIVTSTEAILYKWSHIAFTM